MLVPMFRAIPLLMLLGGLSSCSLLPGSSPEPAASTSLSQTQRFDPTTRTWISEPLTPAQQATASSVTLREEKASAEAQVLSTTTPPPVSAETPAAEVADATMEEQPGMLGRVGRAASAPLRWVGLGGGDE